MDRRRTGHPRCALPGDENGGDARDGPGRGCKAYEFSVIEALYARGFTSASTITKLSGNDFAQALTGTVAYDLANAIYSSASKIAPPGSAVSAPPGFQPINSDGSLTNCVPPPCASPLGPIAYLGELLALSQLSTRDGPLRAGRVAADQLATRRSGSTLPFVSTAGVIAGMTVSGVNVEQRTTVSVVTATSVSLSQPITADIPSSSSITFTPVPLGACHQPTTRPDRQPRGQQRESGNRPAADRHRQRIPGIRGVGGRHTPRRDRLRHHRRRARRISVVPSRPVPGRRRTPALSRTGPDLCCAARVFDSGDTGEFKRSDAIQQRSYSRGVEQLETDFSSCRLPYSQALDVSRTYLRHFGSCRYEEMRTFRNASANSFSIPPTSPTGLSPISGACRCASISPSNIWASRPKSMNSCSAEMPIRLACSSTSAATSP